MTAGFEQVTKDTEVKFLTGRFSGVPFVEIKWDGARDSVILSAEELRGVLGFAIRNGLFEGVEDA